MQNNVFYTNNTLNIRGRLMDLSSPRVMGILNITPDSFHDGGKFTDLQALLAQAARMLEEGADILDIGGYSSRPGATDISEEEEASRVMPAIKIILQHFPHAILSIDTFRAGIAQRALEAGASLVNDISGGALDPRMFETVAANQVPYIMMHMRGTPQTMATLTDYDDLVQDLINYFHPRIHTLRKLGVKDIILDPGFGFAKTVAQNFELLNHLERLAILGVPMLVGLSRKSMIWRTLGVSHQDALTGTIALQTLALTKGASILRVHDVREARETIQLLAQMPPTTGYAHPGRIKQKH